MNGDPEGLTKLLAVAAGTLDRVSPVYTFIHQKFDPKNLRTSMAVIERNSSILAQDVRFLIKFYLNSTSSSRLRVTSEDYQEYEKLIKKYGVEKKAMRDNITLHRIAASFPIVSVNLLLQLKIDRKFSTDMLRAKDAGDFPWTMRMQMCLSLAPTEPPYVNYLDQHNLIFGIIAYMYYEKKIVNDTKKVVEPSAIFEKVLNIAHTIYTGSNVDEEEKKEEWKHVVYDYIDNKDSVNGLLRHFRSEIPNAEAAFKNRFRFVFKIANKDPGRAKSEGPAQTSKQLVK